MQLIWQFCQQYSAGLLSFSFGVHANDVLHKRRRDLQKQLNLLLNYRIRVLYISVLVSAAIIGKFAEHVSKFRRASTYFYELSK
jgi:hypothetical protein